MIKEYKAKEINDVISAMVDYASSCDDNNQKTAYILNLMEQPYPELWFKIINSGLFHDAIGKVINLSETNVVVSTDY